MSSTAPQTSPPSSGAQDRIKIVSHSDLFYWWPVWAVGFLMALLTYLDGHKMAIVPDGTVAEKRRRVEGQEGPHDVLVVPPDKELPLDPATGTLAQPHLRMASSNSLGATFATVLLLVILITNVRLRGIWTLVVLLILVLGSIIFALAGWWDGILGFLEMADVHINAFGYLCISTPLFVVWLVIFVFFDRLVYVSFSPGQFQMHLAVGTGETAYDVRGMIVEKKRDDLFRHWILGFGSGDLVVRTGGASPQTFELPNVLFVGFKLQMVQQMLQERPVVSR
jgi:hypothetical protein